MREGCLDGHSLITAGLRHCGDSPVLWLLWGWDRGEDGGVKKLPPPFFPYIAAYYLGKHKTNFPSHCAISSPLMYVGNV